MEMYATHFVLTILLFTILSLSILSLFALKLYRLSRIGKLGFFKRPLLFQRIPLFSLSSLPLPFFSFFFALEAYRIRNTRRKFISTGVTINFREFKV